MPPQFDPERISKSDVQNLLKKVSVRPNHEYTEQYPHKMPVKITVRLQDGTMIEHQVEDYPGLFMTITDSTLDGNRAGANGGALDVNQQITVTDSTLAGNEAGGKVFKGMGAAAELDGGATLIVSDSTIAGSTTQPAGRGSIDNFGGSLTLSFATLSGSQGLLTGGGFNSATGTILAGTGATPNCTVSLSETAGYNLSTDSSCGLSKKTDLAGVNPMLKPLADNGGPTVTQALPRSSPAVNAGGLPASSSCPAGKWRASMVSPCRPSVPATAPTDTALSPEMTLTVTFCAAK